MSHQLTIVREGYSDRIVTARTAFAEVSEDDLFRVVRELGEHGAAIAKMDDGTEARLVYTRLENQPDLADEVDNSWPVEALRRTDTTQMMIADTTVTFQLPVAFVIPQMSEEDIIDHVEDVVAGDTVPMTGMRIMSTTETRSYFQRISHALRTMDFTDLSAHGTVERVVPVPFPMLTQQPLEAV